MKFNSYTMPRDEKLILTRQTMSSAGLIYTRQSIAVTAECIYFGRSAEEDIEKRYSASAYYTHHLREQQRWSCYVNFCACPPTRRCCLYWAASIVGVLTLVVVVLAIGIAVESANMDKARATLHFYGIYLPSILSNKRAMP